MVKMGSGLIVKEKVDKVIPKNTNAKKSTSEKKTKKAFKKECNWCNREFNDEKGYKEHRKVCPLKPESKTKTINNTKLENQVKDLQEMVSRLHKDLASLIQQQRYDASQLDKEIILTSGFSWLKIRFRSSNNPNSSEGMLWKRTYTRLREISPESADKIDEYIKTKKIQLMKEEAKKEKDKIKKMNAKLEEINKKT